MDGWLGTAEAVPQDQGHAWWRYLVIDAAGDWWIYSFTHHGLIRWNRFNPAHWVYYARSRNEHAVVRLAFA